MSIEEKSNSFTFLPYDSFYPPTMAVFGNFLPKKYLLQPHLDFTKKYPHKIRLYICVPKVTRKKPKPPLKNDETEPKKFRRPRYIQSIVVLLTHYILINFALILNQKIK
jgi:hypothetical protein